MGELPEGPVTIMFTDIEGSTALRTSLGDAACDALLREHDAIVREEIESHKGQDQKAALGDGFLAVFVSTRRAVACAIAIQRSLDSFNLKTAGPPLRVRIGLNTGEVAWQDGQLSGEAVHAAARVCAEAGGGQVLVSDVTRQLAGTISDVSFVDTGEHQLKGFPQPWRLYEVVWVRETSAIPTQVFVGRGAELAMLRAKLTAALEGRGSLVLVGGEPGVGKTTLVRHLIREAEQRGALAIFGRCYESEGAVPYSPFVEMLEQALSIIPAEIFREDMGDEAPEIARMIPELRRRFPEIGAPLELPPEQQRRYFFNAVAQFISRGAARFPLLLVIDDVHWADEPTLLLIEHMARIFPGLRVLGVGTYRDVELEVSRPLAAGLERMLRARTLERLPLRRFDRDSVADMVGALAGAPAPPQVVDTIYSETEGNPFFVEEVFRHLVEEGKIFDESGAFRPDVTVDELDVPESVRLVVGRRLSRLGEQSQKVLAAGAIVGRAFPFRLLEMITNVDATTLIDVVDEAEEARVIVSEERDGEVHYSFAHELIRQTLLSGLSMVRRQRLHLSVADAIQQLDPRARDERPSEIANHLLRAGSAADPQQLLDFLERSGSRALEAAAFEEAVKTLDDAMTVVDEKDTVRKANLLSLRGSAVRALGRFEECLTNWGAAMDLYEAAGYLPEAGRLAWQIGYLHIWMGRFADAFALYGRGVQAVGDAKVPERVLLQAGMAVLVGFAGDFEGGDALCRDALALARELDDRWAMGVAEWSRCVIAWSNTHPDLAMASGLNAVDYMRDTNDAWSYLDALVWTSFPHLFTGKLEEGKRYALEGLELARRYGHLGGEMLARRGVEIVDYLKEPDLEALERAARKDLELCEAIQSPWSSQSHGWLSLSLQLSGDLETALYHAEEAIRLEPVSAWSGLGWGTKITCLARMGRRDTVLSMLAEPQPYLPDPAGPIPIGLIFRLFSEAHAVAILGLKDEARRYYPLVADRTGRISVMLFDGIISQRITGMVAATIGRWDEAEMHFAEAGRIAREFPDRFDAPSVELWHGKMLLDRGRPEDRDKARGMIADARAEFERRGMPHDAKLAAELLTR